MDFAQLAQLEALRSLASQREFAKLCQKEGELRLQLDALRAYRTELNGPDPELRPMRAIGADILWNRWLDQTQVTLNMSLARVLAQKEGLSQKVRRDVGRSETVKSLHEEADRAQRDTLKKEQLARVVAQSVVHKLQQR